jgi:predicted RNA-binding Zn ribbon-like protein
LVTGQDGYTLAGREVTCQAGYVHVFVSGRPSLDLLGTLKWRRDDAEELLRSAGDVREWFAASTVALRVTLGADDVDAVRAVREALYRSVVAVRGGVRPGRDDLARLNEIAAGPGPQVRLTGSGTVRRSASVEQALAVVVRDAFDLLDHDLARVRDCANPRCTRLYLDTSRGGNRRWCGMAECGNAAKVAAFRARQRS